MRIAVRDGPGRTQPQSLDATLYLPARAPAPAVLLAHGFGQTKDAVAGEARSLAARGYVVLAWSARGFGASTGQIALNAPDYEVADASQLVDWLAARPEVRLDGPGDPRVGVMGGSYGGALALLLAGLRPPRRRGRAPDHLERPRPGALPDDGAAAPPAAGDPAPRARAGRTECSSGPGRRCSSASGPARARGSAARGVPTCAAGSCPQVCAGYVEAVRTGREPPALAAYLAGASPASVAGGSPRRRCWSRARTTPCSASTRPTPPPARSPPGAAPSPSRGSTAGTTAGRPDDGTNARVEGWLDHYLQGVGAAPPTTFTYVLPSGVAQPLHPHPADHDRARLPRPARVRAGPADRAGALGRRPERRRPGRRGAGVDLERARADRAGRGRGRRVVQRVGVRVGLGRVRRRSGGSGGAASLLGRLASDLPGQAATFTTAPLPGRTVVSGVAAGAASPSPRPRPRSGPASRAPPPDRCSSARSTTWRPGRTAPPPPACCSAPRSRRCACPRCRPTGPRYP